MPVNRRPIRVRQTGAKCAQHETEPSSESDSDWQSCTPLRSLQQFPTLGPERGTHFLDLSQQKDRYSLPPTCGS